MHAALFKLPPPHLLIAAVVLITLTGYPGFSQPLGPEEIIRRAAEVNGSDWKNISGFDYYVSRREGEVTRTYDAVMLAGTRYSRLVAIDGRLLSGKDEAEEQRKFETTAARRRGEDRSERERRIRQYQKENEQYQTFAREAIKALDFTLEGREMVSTYEAYVLKGEPRPGYEPPNRYAKVLTGMQGTVWISVADFHLLKLDAEVVSPVRMEGFPVQIEPGTRIELEQAPVAEGQWMPSHFSMDVEARVLLLVPHSERESRTYFDYRRSGSGPAKADNVF